MLLPLICLLAAAPAPDEAYADPLSAPPRAAVTRRDAERLRDHLEFLALSSRDQRLVSSIGLIGVGMLGGGLGYVAGGQIADPDSRTNVTMMSLVAGGSLALAGLVTFFIPYEPENIYADFMRLDLSSDEAAARAVEITEQRLVAFAAVSRGSRLVLGYMAVGVGGVSTALGLAAAVFGSRLGQPVSGLGVVLASSGALVVGEGLFFLTAYRAPIERALELYHKEEKGLREGPTLEGVGLAPVAGGGWVAGLSGRF